MAALPVGWGSRANSIDPEVAEKESRTGDWRALTLEHRYTEEALAIRDSSGMPLGWAMRENCMTMEELSMSSSACTAAVAEVVLHRTPAISDHEVKGDSTIHDQQRGRMHQWDDIRREEESTVSLLASALLKMDSKMTSQNLHLEHRLRDIEERIALILQRQDQMIHALDRFADQR